MHQLYGVTHFISIHMSLEQVGFYEAFQSLDNLIF